MRLLVSAKNLHNAIGEAFNNNITEFTAAPEGITFGTIFFVGGVAFRRDNYIYKGKFDRDLFIKVHSFLRQIPDQPIKIEFLNFGKECHDVPEIELGEISIKF